MKKKAKNIALENQTLEERISYFSTREFREQEARQKLGLKKPEETVVAIKEDMKQETENTSSNNEAKYVETSTLPNYQKWWGLFFAKN